MNLANFAGTVTSLLGIGGALAAIVFGLLAARNQVTIKSLEGTVGALQGEVKAKDLAIATRNGTIEEKEKQIELLTQKAQVLENITTQAPEITQLVVVITKQHKESQKSMANMTEKLGDIAAALGRGEVMRRKETT